VVLLILAVIWAAVLIPPLLGARAEARPADSIGDFRRQLSVLRRTAPVSMPPAHTMGNVVPIVPVQPAVVVRDSARRRRTLKRRRDVFYALLTAMGGSLLLAVVGLKAMLGLHLLLDVAFAGYVAMLVRMRNETAERDMKVRFLPQHGSAAEPVLALRRSAN